MDGRLHTKPLDWLQLRLQQWQRCSRMVDWDIQVEVIRIYTFRKADRGAGIFGETCTWATGRHAEISLMDPVDYEVRDHYPYDMELTLAEELCHG